MIVVTSIWIKGGIFVTTALEQLNRLENSREYLVRKLSILMKNYPEQYVAIVDGNVVFSDPDLDALLAKVKEKYGSTESVLIDYITSKRSEIIV